MDRRHKYRDRLMALGLPHGRPVKSYLRQLEVCKAQHKTPEGRKVAVRAEIHYRYKLAKEAGGWSEHKLAEAIRKRRESKLRRIREARQML